MKKLSPSEALRKIGPTQITIAERLGVSQPTICKILSNQSAISIRLAAQVASRLNMRVDVSLDGKISFAKFSR